MGSLKTYSSDLTDAEWQRIEPLLPTEKPVGRLREVNLPEVLDAIFYRVENGVSGETYRLIVQHGKRCMAIFDYGCA